MTALLKLNLGAGLDIRDGYVNHDLTKHAAGIDVSHDLNVRPWPWADETFAEILAQSVLEHLQITLIESLDECHRILGAGGILSVKYPLYTSPFIHHDPTHRWFWSERVFDYFDPRTQYGKEYPYYTARKWHIVGQNGDTKARNYWVTLCKI